MSKPLSKYGKGMIIKRHKFQNKMGDEFSVLKLAINVAEFKEIAISLNCYTKCFNFRVII